MSDRKGEAADRSNAAESPTVVVVEPRRELPRLKVEAPVADDDDEEDDGGDSTPSALPLLLPPGFLQVPSASGSRPHVGPSDSSEKS